MEHKIVLGGEQFLPFARSRIRALRALGLPYADQSFEIDGVSIKVRIEPGHEYIRLEGSPTVYMESGQLEWSYPGELNPERFNPAKWRFLDIPTSDEYLGHSEASGKNIGRQKNKPALSEGMDSQAVGYPKANPNDAEKDAKSQEDYGNFTVMKKLVVGIFPASLWTGKMRLFMQAQYGAMESKLYMPFYADISGSSVLLMYQSAKGDRLQLGLWGHDSPGIYRATDGSYWLIRITNPTMRAYAFTVYPITLSPSTAGLVARLNAPGVSEVEKTQCEAYVLAYAQIDISKGLYFGGLPSDAEGAMSYGWKFNANGGKASIVVHKLMGTGDHDNSWYSKTIHCTFISKIENGVRVFSMTSEVRLNGEWTDGWGTYNIFVPEQEWMTSPSVLHSLKTDTYGCKPDFNFTAVEVYGYYKDDEWFSVKMSRQVLEAPFPKVTQTGDDAFIYGPGFDMSTLHRIDYGIIKTTESFNYEQHTVYDGQTMSLSVGGKTYQGESFYGGHYYVDRVVAGATTQANTVGFFSPSSGLGSWNGVTPITPTGWPTSGIAGGGSITVANCTVASWSQEGWRFKAWALILPGCDAEAVYIATQLDEKADQNLNKNIASTSGCVINFSGSTTTYGEPEWPDYSPGVSYSFTPYTNAKSTGAWYGFSTSTQLNLVERKIFPLDYRVYASNSKLLNAEGTPGGSYYGLFNVSRDYTQYDRGMYSYTSYGKRYALSEGLKTPESVDYRHRFVGWA